MSTFDFDQPTDVSEDFVFLDIDEAQHSQLEEFKVQFPNPNEEQIKMMADCLRTDETSVKKWYKMNEDETHKEDEGEIENYWNRKIKELKRGYEDKIKYCDRKYAKLEVYSDSLSKTLAEKKSDLASSKENNKVLMAILEAKETEIQEKSSIIERLLSGNLDAKTPEKPKQSEDSELLRMEIEEIQKIRNSESESHRQNSESLKAELETAEKELRDSNRKLMDLEFDNGENLKKIQELLHILETEKVTGDDVVMMKLQKKDQKIQEFHDYIEDVLKPRIKILEAENEDYHNSMLEAHNRRVKDSEKIRRFELQCQGFQSTVSMLKNSIVSSEEEKDLIMEGMNAEDYDYHERLQRTRKSAQRLRRQLEEKKDAYDALQNHIRTLLYEADSKNDFIKRLKKRVRIVREECEQWKTNYMEANGCEFHDSGENQENYWWRK